MSKSRSKKIQDNALDDVEFTEVELAESVRPLRSIMTCVACTICAVIDYARGDENVAEVDVADHFRELGDTVLQFLKVGA